jgi:polar amino acid transport system substrate-binding protein
MRFFRSLISTAVLFALGSNPAIAQKLGADGEDPKITAATQNASDTLVVATREVPPFAFRDSAGNSAGISIKLWEEMAGRLNIDYEFEETDLASMIDRIASGRFGAGVAALTVTQDREKLVDFTHPFFTTGLAIATRPQAGSTMSALSGLMTWRAALAVIGVVGALVAVGATLWFVERHRNEEYFGGPSGEGVAGGVWQALAMFVTGEYADQAPRTMAGRVLSTVWVVSSVILLTVFTGIVTSALTIEQIQGRVGGIADLPQMRIGTLPASTSEAWLTAERIASISFANLEEGLDALIEGRVDAIVYDAPVLKYLSRTAYADQIFVLPETFAPQDYSIALTQGSAMRESLNRELLAIKESDEWAERVFEYLGVR